MSSQIFRSVARTERAMLSASRSFSVPQDPTFAAAAATSFRGKMGSISSLYAGTGLASRIWLSSALALPAAVSDIRISRPLSICNQHRLFTEASAPAVVQDVSNAELKERIEKYFNGDEEALPLIMEAILRRKLAGKHEETDDELMEELRMQPLADVKDREFEEDFDELYSTDEEIPDLYNARNYVEQKMTKDEYFNMDEHKWDDMVQEAVEKGFVKDTSECERILEDMLKWDNLLPDEIKQKVEAKFHELGDLCEKGELQPEEAYEQFKQFEDKMVLECAEMMESKEQHEGDENISESQKDGPDDPPGEGPILRWETRAVFAPGGDSWHPKNRKVKLSVTVKELGLSRHAFRRLREVVGKRYHPGRDELVLISERFEHREENRKDCLRTLYALIDDARSADKLVDETRNAYVKERLKANPQFMERLRTKLSQAPAFAASPL